jgi:hypothetical protein
MRISIGTELNLPIIAQEPLPPSLRSMEEIDK